MPRPRRNGLAAILLVASLAYPAAVYFGRSVVPPLAFVAVALLLTMMRTVTLDMTAAKAQRALLIASAVALVILAALDPPVAAKSYPVVVSAAFAAAFGMSLVHPPTLIERFARLHEPDLPPGAREYCRGVTMVWTAWLCVNALVALGLAIVGSDAAWALWTGVIAYLVMGLLFAGEIVVRRVVVGPRTAA
jgi:uncharacterized membrane protein